MECYRCRILFDTEYIDSISHCINFSILGGFDRMSSYFSNKYYSPRLVILHATTATLYPLQGNLNPDLVNFTRKLCHKVIMGN